MATLLMLLLMIARSFENKHFYTQEGRKLKVAVLVPKKLMGGPGMVFEKTTVASMIFFTNQNESKSIQLQRIFDAHAPPAVLHV